MIENRIPMHRLRNRQFTSFLEETMHRKMPSETQIRSYVDKDYDKELEMIRKELTEQYFWISFDETTDATGRAVGLVLAAKLSKENATLPFIISCDELSEVNNKTVSQLILQSLSKVFPNGIPFNRVLLFLSDGASFIGLAFETLHELFTKMQHVICVVHGLNRVAEQVRAQYADVNILIGSVKALFCKARERVRAYQSALPGVPLPPEPIITRFSSWLKAVRFYALYLEVITPFIENVDPEISVFIEEAQEAIRAPSLKEEIATISAHYDFLVDIICKLENRNLSLSDSLDIVESVHARLTTAPGKKGQTILLRYNSVFFNNKGLKELIKIRLILDNQGTEKDIFNHYTIDEILHFRFAPINSCEFERAFFQLKLLLSDRQRTFKMSNFGKHLAIEFHRTLKEQNKCLSIATDSATASSSSMSSSATMLSSLAHTEDIDLEDEFNDIAFDNYRLFDEENDDR
jgi:hypothetical protein